MRMADGSKHLFFSNGSLVQVAGVAVVCVCIIRRSFFWLSGASFGGTCLGRNVPCE